MFFYSCTLPSSTKSRRPAGNTPPQQIKPYMGRRFSDEYGISLDLEKKITVALEDTEKLNAILTEAEEQFYGEEIRFLLAILEFEKIINPHLKNKRVSLASKMISNFVKPGATYECGCLSSKTRDKLLLWNITKGESSPCMDLFQEAKYEVLKDIYMISRGKYWF